MTPEMLPEQIPHGPAHLDCPFHKQSMEQVCHKCPLWVRVRGQGPQDDTVQDLWDCTFAFMPRMILENARVERQTGAAIESFRNETVKDNEALRESVQAVGQAIVSEQRKQNDIMAAAAFQIEAKPASLVTRMLTWKRG